MTGVAVVVEVAFGALVLVALALVEAAVKALRDGQHGYTPATGIPALREAVARRTLAIVIGARTSRPPVVDIWR